MLLKIQFLILLFFQMNETPTPINDMALLVREHYRLDASSMLLLVLFLVVFPYVLCVFIFFCYSQYVSAVFASDRTNPWIGYFFQIRKTSLSLPLQFFLQKMSPFSSSVHFVRFHIEHLRIYERFWMINCICISIFSV